MKGSFQRREEARRREEDRVSRARQEEQERVARERKQEALRAVDAGLEAQSRGLYREAIREYERAAELGDTGGWNGLAWLYATCKDSNLLDGKRAVECALKAVNQRPDEANFLDTLAAAYARDGQYDQAISAQIRALSISRVGGGEERLKLYRQQSAYQEE